MTYSGGQQPGDLNQAGNLGIGGNLSSISGIVNDWMAKPGSQPGTIVGEEEPQWFFNTPDGTSNTLPQDVQAMFFRQDAGPSGLNEYLQKEMKSNPAIIDRFRAVINEGLVRPVNQAARQISLGYGGYRAGDMTPLGPLINGMPSGLNESQLNTLANIIKTGADYQLGLIEKTGYFNGIPTIEAEKIKQTLAQGWMQQAINQFQQQEVSRSNQATEGLKQEEITNQNIQKMAELFGGQMTTDPATGQGTFTPTEAAREFNTKESGYLDGQATLSREQQAFNQAKDVAQAASNPRDYIYAQMLGNARGGLGGQPATNQIQQTTFGPPTATSQPQFSAPGGQYGQLQNLSTMQGLQPNQLMGAQSSQYAQAPNAQQQSQQPVDPSAGAGANLGNPDWWRQSVGDANAMWGNAQQGINGLSGFTGWSGLMQGFAPGSVPGTTGGTPAPPPSGYPGTGNPAVQPTGMGFQMPGASTMMYNPAAGQDAAGAAGMPVTTSAFTQQLLKNRVVPQTGAIQGQGAYMTPGQIQGAFSPNKIRAQDYLRGRDSEQKGFQAVGSMAGYSGEDLTGAIKNNLPSFKAPGAGKMI